MFERWNHKAARAAANTCHNALRARWRDRREQYEEGIKGIGGRVVCDEKSTELSR